MMDGTRTRMDTDPLCAVLAPPSAERLRQRLGVGADARVELATTGWCKVVVLFETIAVLVPRHHEFVPAIRREIRALGALDSGCAYPDTTLRTFIDGPMCLNSPDHHAAQYGDLARAGRALYRLAVGDDLAATEQQPPPPPSTADALVEAAAPAGAPWFWEGNVQAAVVHQLASDRWHIRRVADTAIRERGVDIEADREGT
jgi:hypothetical protein